jgi:hypothetical protein
VRALQIILREQFWSETGRYELGAKLRDVFVREYAMAPSKALTRAAVISAASCCSLRKCKKRTSEEGAPFGMHG